MATITVAAGGGNWTTGSTWIGGVAPTAADDAVLTGTASVTITTGAVARSLDCTGYTGTLTHTAAVTLVLGDATAGAGNVALKLVAGMTYSLGNATSSSINFVSTSTTVQTVTWGGKTPGDITFNGVGGSWQVQDAWNASATTVTFANGTLNTNSQTCVWSIFSSLVTNTRTLTLGSSSVTLTGANAASVAVTGTGLTITANTASFSLTGPNSRISSTSNWNGLSVLLLGSGDSTIGSTTVANLTRVGTALKTDKLLLSGNPVVTGALTLTGDSITNRLLILSNSDGTTRSITCNGSISAANVDFQDTNGIGSASWNLAAISGGSGNCLGNSGITFTSSAAQTHTASAGGNWSDATKWTSRVPLPQDDVAINANTTGTITADMPRLGRNIDFTNFAGTADLTSLGNTLYGNLTFVPAMTVTSSQSLTLAGRSSHTVFGAGKTLGSVTINAVDFSNGVYTFQSEVIATSGVTLLSGGLTLQSPLTITSGALAASTNTTFNTNNNTVTAASLSFSGSTNGTPGTSTFNITGTSGTVWSMNVNPVSFSSATVIFTNTSASSRTFAGGNKTYGTFTYTVAGSTGALVVTGANTFTNFNFSDTSNARTVTFPASTTTTFTNFNVSGTPGKVMTINSSTTSTAATLSKTAGTVSGNYLSIRDSAATGGALWYAGFNSTNVSGNSGWIFTAPLNRGFLSFLNNR